MLEVVVDTVMSLDSKIVEFYLDLHLFYFVCNGIWNLKFRYWYIIKLILVNVKTKQNKPK